MDIFDLVATLKLDTSEYTKNLKGAKADADDFGGGADGAAGKASKLAGMLKNGLAVAAKAGAVALGAASVAVVKLAKDAVASYAQYEQLVGGVDTLFKESSALVQKYASEAYLSAGMSANAYMENVTAFSASLLQSLGGDTKAAADYANQAMIDMSDNANKMGTSIDSIVATYQSLSRGNFAMLDNLKLGYGGTKAEMERLIADAAKLDSSVKENDMSFGNMVKAIHAVQEELGIAGATALEASTTIEGSANAMRAAWENLKVGFADENADMGALIQQFFDSVVTYAQNIIPRFAQAVQGVGKALVVAINEYIPQALEMVAAGAPQMLQQGGELVGSLVTGLIKAIPKIIAATPQLILALLEGIGAFIGEVLLAGANLVGEFVSGINSRIASVGGSGREVAAMFKQSIMDIVNAAKNWGRDLIQNFVGGIKSKLGDLKNAASNMAQTVRGYIHFTKPDVGPLSDFDTYAPDMIDLFTEGLDKNAYKIGEQFNKSLDFGVETVPYAQSSYGVTSAATMNAVASGGATDTIANGVIRLMTPEGRTLAEWLFEDILAVAKAQGKPLMV